MGFKDQKWSKGAHLEQTRFWERKGGKMGEEVRAWERSRSRWDFFLLLASKRSSNLQVNSPTRSNCVIKQMFLYRPVAQQDYAGDSNILYTENID